MTASPCLAAAHALSARWTESSTRWASKQQHVLQKGAASRLAPALVIAMNCGWDWCNQPSKEDAWTLFVTLCVPSFFYEILLLILMISLNAIFIVSALAIL